MCPSHLSESSVRVICPGRPSKSPCPPPAPPIRVTHFLVTHPSHPSESPIRDTHPSRPSASPPGQVAGFAITSAMVTIGPRPARSRPPTRTSSFASLASSDGGGSEPEAAGRSQERSGLAREVAALRARLLDVELEVSPPHPSLTSRSIRAVPRESGLDCHRTASRS